MRRRMLPGRRRADRVGLWSNPAAARTGKRTKRKKCEAPDKKMREATGDWFGLSPRAVQALRLPEGSFQPVQIDPCGADCELDRRPMRAWTENSRRLRTKAFSAGDACNGLRKHGKLIAQPKARARPWLQACTAQSRSNPAKNRYGRAGWSCTRHGRMGGIRQPVIDHSCDRVYSSPRTKKRCQISAFVSGAMGSAVRSVRRPVTCASIARRPFWKFQSWKFQAWRHADGGVR
jgi:hypothetical protein